MSSHVVSALKGTTVDKNRAKLILAILIILLDIEKSPYFNLFKPSYVKKWLKNNEESFPGPRGKSAGRHVVFSAQTRFDVPLLDSGIQCMTHCAAMQSKQKKLPQSTELNQSHWTDGE